VSKTDALKIGCDICRGMSAFREKGIIHHNITPENIYVDALGNYKLGLLGLYDFSGNISEGSLYMAPELYQSSHMPDTTSDIYALGMVMYKLLNNNRFPFLPAYPSPISLTDREQSFSRCMRGEKFPAPANADFRLSTVIAKATAYRADERYITPFAMLSQLEGYSPYMPPAPQAPVVATGFEIKQNEGIHFDSYDEPEEESVEELMMKPSTIMTTMSHLKSVGTS
jgi:serine/threonine-protein kinase